MTPSRQKRPDYLEDETDPVFQKSPAAKLNKVDVKNVKALPQAFAEINQELQLRPKKGEDGRTPRKGEDYFTQKEIEEIVNTIHRMIPVPKDGAIPVCGVDYFTDDDISMMIDEVLANIREPQDGRDAVIDYEYVIQNILEILPKPKDAILPRIPIFRSSIPPVNPLIGDIWIKI